MFGLITIKELYDITGKLQNRIIDLETKVQKVKDSEYYSEELDKQRDLCNIVLVFNNILSIERDAMGYREEKTVVTIKTDVDNKPTEDLSYYCSRAAHNRLCEEFKVFKKEYRIS
jgi:hypothetical protein